MKKFPGDDQHIPDKRAVALCSGGIDSTVTIAYALRAGFEVVALTVDYGQPRAELLAASRICKHYGLEQIVMDVRETWSRIAPSRITGDKPPEVLTLEELRKQQPSPYIVPGRNTMLISCAEALVESRGLSAILFGGNLEDSLGFPDCRREYLDAFEKALSYSAQRPVHIISPFLQCRKQDIVKIADDWGDEVPLRFTSTCYHAFEHEDRMTDRYPIHCGRCPSCLLRREAFENAKVHDPTIYARED